MPDRTPPPILPGDLISPKTAARLLSVHISTIYRYIHTGRLRSYWIAGTRHRVRRRDVEALATVIEPAARVQTETQLRDEYDQAIAELRARGLRI